MTETSISSITAGTTYSGCLLIFLKWLMTKVGIGGEGDEGIDSDDEDDDEK